MLLQTCQMLKIQKPDVRTCKVSRRSQAVPDPNRAIVEIIWLAGLWCIADCGQDNKILYILPFGKVCT